MQQVYQPMMKTCFTTHHRPSVMQFAEKKLQRARERERDTNKLSLEILGPATTPYNVSHKWAQTWGAGVMPEKNTIWNGKVVSQYWKPLLPQTKHHAVMQLAVKLQRDNRETLVLKFTVQQRQHYSVFLMTEHMKHNNSTMAWCLERNTIWREK
jgi:hypothetical protein